MLHEIKLWDVLCNSLLKNAQMDTQNNCNSFKRLMFTH